MNLALLGPKRDSRDSLMAEEGPQERSSSPSSDINDKENKMTSTESTPKRGSTRQRDIPHSFQEHTYRKPTHCDVCDGLLVGLWSQGLQCSFCQRNVHRGQGKGEHDDCRAEALLQPCPGHSAAQEPSPPRINPREKDPMRVLQEVTKQLDRDLMAHARQAVVITGIKDERSRKLRRLKLRVLKWKCQLAQLEAGGEVHVTLVLAAAKMAVASFFAVGTYGIVLLTLWLLLPRTNLPLLPLQRLALLHAFTILCGIQTAFWLVAVALYKLSAYLHRKVDIIDKFLREMLDLRTEDDIGVSVEELADLFHIWSGRGVRSATISLFLITSAWLYLHSPHILLG